MVFVWQKKLLNNGLNNQRYKMTKLQIKFTVTVEYEADPDNYPEGSKTPEGMLAIDLVNAEDDPFMMITGDADWKITGRILKS